MGIEACLKLDVNEAGGVIDKDTAAQVHVTISSLAKRVEETPFRAAYEVID